MNAAVRPALPPACFGLPALRIVLVASLLGGLVHSAPAQHDSFHTPVIDSIRAAEDSVAAARAAQAAPSADDRHAIIRGLNTLGDVLPPQLLLALLLLGFIVIPVGSAVGFAAMALFSESGCLRGILAVMGWCAALLSGLMGGGLLSMWLDGGLSFLAGTGVVAGGLGYPILYLRAREKVRQLSQAEYVTWKHTLAGGALLGTGVSSAASLGRSVGALFKGGGGSFGGGGASGAFGSGPVASVSATTAQGASAPGAVASSTAAVSAVRATSEAGRSAGGRRIKQWTQAVAGFTRRLRWYHGVAFVLIGLVFLPVGLGVASIVQRPRLLLWIAGVYTLCRAYRLIARTSPKGNVSDVITGIFTMLLFMAPFVGGALAAESQAPQWHLVITLTIAAVIEVGFFVLPDHRLKADAPSSPAASFRGGTVSESW